MRTKAMLPFDWQCPFCSRDTVITDVLFRQEEMLFGDEAKLAQDFCARVGPS